MNKQFYSLANKIHCVSFKRGEKQMEINEIDCRGSYLFNLENSMYIARRKLVRFICMMKLLQSTISNLNAFRHNYPTNIGDVLL